jgi:hypothetical protein
MPEEQKNLPAERGGSIERWVPRNATDKPPILTRPGYRSIALAGGRLP